MNADKRRLKRIGLSMFIGVNRRLQMPFSDFFSSLLEAWGCLFDTISFRADAVALPSGIGFTVRCTSQRLVLYFARRYGGIMFVARAGFGTFSNTAVAAVNPFKEIGRAHV